MGNRSARILKNGMAAKADASPGSTPNDIALQEKDTDQADGDCQDGVMVFQGGGGLQGPPDGGDGRETWDKKVDFLLSVIGFAVDLANVWRFPYLCYKNGGGAFLVPYVLMLILAGIPLFYMELALGQFNRKGAITCWGRICPLFKGVGYSVVLIAFYTDFYYNVIISWALYYFFNSFTASLPWIDCNNTWNTLDCYDGLFTDNSSVSSWIGNLSDVFKSNADSAYQTVTEITPSNFSNVTEDKRISPALEYFERYVLEIQHTDGVSDIGQIKWQLVLCLLAVYIICYFSLWKGVSTSGKVVWFTAVFPYVVLIILLVRGVTLPGSELGIKYYLTPDFSRLTDAEVWTDAATQVFFSLGPGFGVLLAFASYNQFHNNVYYDALATSTINCCTSFLAGFVIFSVLGYMSEKSGRPIDTVATEGPGLVFVVYPEAIATLPGATFWSLIFFMMLLTLGLDSSFGGSEAIITALSDEFPLIRNNREIFVGLLFSFYFIIGLPSCTQGGSYIVNLLDRYAAGYSILMAVFIETLAVSWFYGVNRFADDIKSMVGFRPGIYWRLCWKFIAPAFIFCIMVFGFIQHRPLEVDGYRYPLWANTVGWCVAASSILCLPGLAIYNLIITKGTLKQRFRILMTPWRDQQKTTIIADTEHFKVMDIPPEQV